LVKVRAALAHHRARGEEQIHQHGLAAADVAENVEALGRAGAVLGAAEYPAEGGRLARQPMLGEARVEAREAGDARFLCRVALELAGDDEGSVTVADGIGHAGLKEVEREWRVANSG